MKTIVFLTLIHFSFNLLAQNGPQTKTLTVTKSANDVQMIEAIKLFDQNISILKTARKTHSSKSTYEVVAPDLEIATITLKKLIRRSLTNYFSTLSNIIEELSENNSKIQTLVNSLRASGGESSLRLSEIQEMQYLPELFKKLNIDYHAALGNLFTLGGSANFPMVPCNENALITGEGYCERSIGNIYNILRQEINFKVSEKIIGSTSNGFNYNKSIWAFCKTQVCLVNLQDQVLEWIKFVRVLNQKISLAYNGENGLSFTSKSNVSTTPFFAIDILYAANDFLKIGLEKNTSYTLSKAIVEILGDTLRSVTVGIPVTILGSIVGATEILLLNIKKILSYNVMLKDYTLQPVFVYDQPYTRDVLDRNISVYAKKFPVGNVLQVCTDRIEVSNVWRYLLNKTKNDFSFYPLENATEEELVSMEDRYGLTVAELQYFVKDHSDDASKKNIRGCVIKKSSEGGWNILQEKNLLFSSRDFNAIIEEAKDLVLNGVCPARKYGVAPLYKCSNSTRYNPNSNFLYLNDEVVATFGHSDTALYYSKQLQLAGFCL